MSISIINLLIQLLSGAVGGNIAGALLKQFSLGPAGNSIAGIVGGGIGGQVLGMLLGAAGGTGGAGAGFDVGSIIAQVVGGGVGGGLLMAFIGIIRQALGGGSAR